MGRRGFKGVLHLEPGSFDGQGRELIQANAGEGGMSRICVAFDLSQMICPVVIGAVMVDTCTSFSVLKDLNSAVLSSFPDLGLVENVNRSLFARLLIHHEVEILNNYCDRFLKKQ
jgi:hypothetical protein